MRYLTRPTGSPVTAARQTVRSVGLAPFWNSYFTFHQHAPVAQV